MEANLFFTFFGLDAVHKARHEHIKLATVGNPGLHLATWAGGLPGVSSVMTRYMASKMDALDVPSIPEFVEMIADAGAGCTPAKHPPTCSACPWAISSTRSRTSSPWGSSMISLPAARSSSRDPSGLWRAGARSPDAGLPPSKARSGTMQAGEGPAANMG
jgi:DsrE/DsrF/DrsH-like family